jgi:hypothetical protein
MLYRWFGDSSNVTTSIVGVPVTTAMLFGANNALSEHASVQKRIEHRVVEFPSMLYLVLACLTCIALNIS